MQKMQNALLKRPEILIFILAEGIFHSSNDAKPEKNRPTSETRAFFQPAELKKKTQWLI